MKKNRMIVYLTTNLVNGMIYVGQDHHDNPKYLGSGGKIDKAKKYFGKENFGKEILEECSTQKEMNFWERYWIDKKHATNPKIGYNVAEGGNIPPIVDWTPEMRRNLSEKLSGKNNWNFGRTGELSPNYGGKNPKAKAVIIDRVRYLTIAEASRELNIGRDAIFYRIKTGKEGYAYADDTQEDIEARRKANIREKDWRAKPVVINGKYYPSIKAAARELNMCAETISYRIKIKKLGYLYYKEVS